jgi:hypothetical protein
MRLAAMTAPFAIVGEYRLAEIDDARTHRDRLRREAQEAMMVVAGDTVFVQVPITRGDTVKRIPAPDAQNRIAPKKMHWRPTKGVHSMHYASTMPVLKKTPSTETKMEQLLETLSRMGAKALPANAGFSNRFEIASASSSRVYVVAQKKATGAWGCSCPGAIHHGQRCKHLKALGLVT